VRKVKADDWITEEDNWQSVIVWVRRIPLINNNDRNIQVTFTFTYEEGFDTIWGSYIVTLLKNQEKSSVRKIPLIHNNERNIQVKFTYEEGFDKVSYSSKPPR
jgi:hypothetical protein